MTTAAHRGSAVFVEVGLALFLKGGSRGLEERERERALRVRNRALTRTTQLLQHPEEKPARQQPREQRKQRQRPSAPWFEQPGRNAGQAVIKSILSAVVSTQSLKATEV